MTASTNSIQSLYDQAEEYRQSRFVEKLTSELKYHFCIKALYRIPELAIALIGESFPDLMVKLTSFFPHNMTITPISKDSPKWGAMIDLTDKLRLKAGIKKTITLCYSTTHKDKLGAFKDYIILNDIFLSYSIEEQEFLIMHELMHHKLTHLNIRLGIGFTFASLDLILLYYYPLAVILSEAAAFYVENTVSCYQEKEADLEAIKHLGTNKGAVTTFERAIEQICPISHLKNTTKFNQEVLRKIQLIAADFSAITHPSAVARLKYSLSAI